MNYAEAAFFDRNHCQHVADYYEARRLARAEASVRAIIETNYREASRHRAFA